ncbi:MAG: hypothetical protein ACQCN4_06245 [Candidatus Bathyarchaeia archaeon]|jgi:hypothetical protein
MNEVEIEFFGPYSLIEDKEPSLFSVQLGKQNGVYLWAIPFENKYLAYYVGETGKSFISRNLEHIRNYYSGKYTLYDPKEFAKGKKIRMWNGMWKKDAKDLQVKLSYQRRHDELWPITDAFLSLLQVFLIPIENNDYRIRQRLEAAISFRLRDHDGVIGGFQDDGVRYSPRWPSEPKIKAKMKTNELLLGLGGELIF